MPADPVEIENAQRKQRYDAYIKERDAFRNDSLTVSDRYDKAILLLGGRRTRAVAYFPREDRTSSNPDIVRVARGSVAWANCVNPSAAACTLHQSDRYE